MTEAEEIVRALAEQDEESGVGDTCPLCFQWRDFPHKKGCLLARAKQWVKSND